MEASAINAAHPDADGDEDFFGTGGVEVDPAVEAAIAAIEQADALAAAAVAEEEIVVAPPAAVAATAVVTQEQVDAAAEAATPVAVGEEESSTTPAGRGSPEREYIVFQEVTLTEKVLRFMMDELAGGKGGTVRVALFELDRVETRNVKLAAGMVYQRHEAKLPDECDLGVVPSKSYTVKHVKPKVRPIEKTVEIT